MKMGEQKARTNDPAVTGTAQLGPLGGADEQGFTHPGNAASRQITITSESGAVIYSKRTADTPKAADNHVAAAGYRRTGEWSNGAATVEKVPTSVRLRKLLMGALVAGAVIAGISVFVGHSNSVVPDAAKNGCQSKVQALLPADAAATFRDITASERPSGDKAWSKSWHVEGKVNTADLTGTVRDVPFACEMYVDGGGDVHKGTVTMKR